MSPHDVPPTSTPVSTTRLQPAAPLIAAAIGAGGPAARIWDHGEGARASAVALVVLAACLTYYCELARPALPNRLAAGALVAAVAAAATVPHVGRAPAVVAIGLTLAADLSRSPRRRAGGPPSLGAGGLVLAGSVAWGAGASLAVPLVGAVVALLLWLAADLGPIRAMDRSVALLVDPAVVGAATVATSIRRALRAGGRTAWVAAGSAAGAVARAARAAVASTGRALRWCSSPENRPAVVVGALAALATAPIFWRIAVDPNAFIRGTNDINSGVPRIRAMSFWPLNITAAHPGWLALMRVMFEITSVAVATTLVSSLATGAAVTVAAIGARSRWDDRPPLRWGLAVVVGLGVVVFESPAVLVPTTDGVWGRFELAGTLGRGTGFLALHQWATPTIVLVLPLTLLTVALLGQLVGGPATPDPDATRTTRRRLAALTIVGTLIQPAPTLALVPAVVIYVAVRQRAAWAARLRSVALPFLVPGTLVVGGQVVFLRSDVSEYEQARWLWRPLWMFDHFGLDRVACWLVLPVFLIPLVADRRRYLASPTVSIPLIGALVALPPALFLEQTTVAAIPDADLAVPMLMSVMVLFVGTLRHVALAAQSWWVDRDGGPPPVWLRCVALMLSAMLAAGLVDLAMAAGVLQEF